MVSCIGAGPEVKLILGVSVSTSGCLSLYGGSVELATHPGWTPVQGGPLSRVDSVSPVGRWVELQHKV